MPYEYNALLKLNLQKKADLEPVQADINDLKQKKVTKFFADTDTLEAGEIAQYQGPDDAVNGLQNGFFYNTSGQITIQTGTPFIEIQADIVGEFSTIKAGKYYNTGHQSVTMLGYRTCTDTNNNTYRFFHFGAQADMPRVGDSFIIPAFTYSETTTYYSITSVSWVTGNTYDITLNNGDALTVTVKTAGGSYAILQEFENNDGKIYLYNYDPYTSFNPVLFADVDNNNAVIYAPFITDGTTDTEVIISGGFAQVDTQPRVQGVENAQDGSLIITRDVKFSGDITVQGTQTIVDTQQIDSENDFINLRYNNPTALADGDTSGMSVKNYDGNDNNLQLVVDNQGWARVGDEGGTLQKLATIEDTPTDGAFVAYNTTSEQLESKAVPETSKTAAGLCPALPNESATTKYLRQDGTWQVPPYPSLATTSAAGLMSASDKTKLNDINLTVTTQTFSTGSNQAICYKFGRIVFVKFSLISSSNVQIGADYQPIENIYGIAHSNNGVSTKVQIVNGVMNLPNNTSSAQGFVCYVSKT